MLRRLLPTLIGLGLGWVALAWGLVSLQLLFAQERRDAHGQLESRRRALQGLAGAALRTALELRLRANLPALQDALTDPLLPAEGLYVSFEGRQLLPRLDRCTASRQHPAMASYEQLTAGAASRQGDGVSAWMSRIEVLANVRAAFDVGNETLALALSDELIRFHGRHPLPPPEDLAFLLYLTESLGKHPPALPLVRMLLREGLPEDAGGTARSAGLQRDLLRLRPRLSQRDFGFLLKRVGELSAAFGVRRDDFQARAAEEGAGALVLPSQLHELTLVGQRWLVEPTGGIVRGVAVDLPAELQALSLDLRRRGLLGPGDEVRLSGRHDAQPLSELWPDLSIRRWNQEQQDVDQRFELKTLLVSICGLLALALVALAVLAQQRKYRFIELKADFVATVSHELRTPLAGIRLLAESLQARAGNAPAAGDYPARIVEAADGLHFLVENILSFHRLSRAQAGARLRRVALEEVVAALPGDLAQLTARAPELDAELENTELLGDPALLRLLFANLGRNACLYNRRQPVAIKLRVHAPDGSHCTLLFSDNGVGIPEDQWENVFQDFVRVPQAGLEVHGSGLGLALCRRIMNVHGGTIRVATSGPEGTTFALRFPGLSP